MFGVNDKTTLTGINVFNKNKEIMGYVLKFPFNAEELELPKDMVQMTIFEYDSSYANFGHKVFKLCIGDTTSLEEINDNPEMGRIEFFPGVFDELESPSDKIFFFLDETGKKILFSKVNDEDIVVSDIKEAKRVLTKISNEYRTIKEASLRLKKCGEKRDFSDVSVDEDKLSSTLGFYTSTLALKDKPRTGWLDWHVNRERIESVSDHVFGTEQLAFALWSELGLEDYVDIDRVIAMLAVHETEEPVIGDIPLVHNLKPYKSEMGKIAVSEITKSLDKKEYIRSLIREFESQSTPEAKLAKYIDKLECDLMSKVYDEEDTVDLNNQADNPSAHVPLVEELLGEGKSFSEMWMGFGRKIYNYPKAIDDLSRYAEGHNLHAMQDEIINEARKKVKVYLDTVRSI